MNPILEKEDYCEDIKVHTSHELEPEYCKECNKTIHPMEYKENNGEYEDFDYYIRYEDYEGNKEDVMVREKDLVGFTKGTGKYLKQELNKLIKDYSKEHILNVLKEI